jgi:hypothetical protein
VNKLIVGVRAALGLLFLYAAASKVPDLRAFAEEVANYRVLPAALVPWLGATLPGIEGVCGLGLLLPTRLVRASAIITGGMLAVFIVALSLALTRGIDLRCGCFGGAEQATWGTVARDVVMLAGCVLVAWRPSGGLPSQAAP